ncbi:MAG TPA: hypothetical protein VFS77_07280 [Pyrinomonadaceae bacterium]|nr:hypothetical protein [Pyrinomonadaceae bacterium]
MGRLVWIIGAAILVLAINVAVSILYVTFYSYTINRGQDPQFYQEYAQTASPYSSIIAGVPLMFLICWRVAGWWEPDFAVKAALLIWLVYAVIDVLVLAAVGMSTGLQPRMIVLAAISLVTKLGAAYFGGILGSQRALTGT